MERGVWQMTRMTLRYCLHSGSSRGVRDFMRSNLRTWAEAHPHVSVHLEQVNGKAPVVIGHYPKDVEKAINLDNKDDKSILKHFNFLSNSTGRRPTRVTSNQFREVPSFQGSWAPDCTSSTEFIVKHY